MISLFLTTLIQTVSPDTASSGFAPKWQGAETSNSLMTMMASHDLIFVVLAVSLIIWFVLLFLSYEPISRSTSLRKK